MYQRFIAITIGLLVVLIVSGQAENGEKIDAFPHGPVKEITTTVKLEDGKVLITENRKVNRQGQVIEIIQGIEAPIKGFFSWSSSNNINEATIYTGSQFWLKFRYKYDTSKEIGKRSISWNSSDVIDLLFEYEGPGNLVERSHYNRQDQMVQRDVYERDPLGKRMLYKKYDSHNQIIYRTETTYYSPGQVQEENAYDHEGNLEYKKLNRYNSLGKIEESIDKYASGNRESRTTYQYDNLGALIESLHFLNGMVKSRTVYEQSENPKKTKSTQTDPNGNTIYSEETVWDEHGNITEKSTQYGKEDARKELYIYDERNRNTRREDWERNQRVRSHEIVFNEKGNRIQEEWSYNQPDLTEHSIINFQYDPYGNMTQRVTTKTVGKTNPYVTELKIIWQYSYFDDEE